MKLGELQKLAKNLAQNSGANLQEQMHRHILAMGLDPNNFYQELENNSIYKI